MILGFSNFVQLSVFVKAIGAGYILGLFFSLVMFFNIFAGKSNISVFIRDILFFVSGAFFSFLFVLKYNSGIIRFYILAGELMGFCIFYIVPGKSMSELWRKLFEKYTEFKKVVADRIKIKSEKYKDFQKKRKQRKVSEVNFEKNNIEKIHYKHKLKKQSGSTKNYCINIKKVQKKFIKMLKNS